MTWNNTQTGEEEETYEYNQEALKDVHRKQAAESRKKEEREKRKEYCSRRYIHPNDLPRGNDLLSSITGMREGKKQLREYRDCMRGMETTTYTIYGY